MSSMVERRVKTKIGIAQIQVCRRPRNIDFNANFDYYDGVRNGKKKFQEEVVELLNQLIPNELGTDMTIFEMQCSKIANEA